MTRIAIVMPVLGFEQESGTLPGWLKRVGDPIDRGDA
jgi:pyruvate/2-oxoglutarate dehydrogenase complex dihydrolipoamide acyltransferase (E2) component